MASGYQPAYAPAYAAWSAQPPPLPMPASMPASMAMTNGGKGPTMQPQYSPIQMPIGSPLNGEGWGQPVWSWAIVFLLVIAIAVLVIITLVKVCGIYPSKNVKECYDGNYCTTDYKVRGGCFSLRRPNGKECTNVCYASGEESSCSDGVCIGNGCLGQCANVSVCPSIAHNATNLPGGFNSTACTKNRCIYTATSGLGPTYASQCSNTRLEAECLAFIADNETQKDCLGVDVFCSYGASGMTFSCQFYYACAKPYYSA